MRTVAMPEAMVFNMIPVPRSRVLQLIVGVSGRGTDAWSKYLFEDGSNHCCEIPSLSPFKRLVSPESGKVPHTQVGGTRVN